MKNRNGFNLLGYFIILLFIGLIACQKDEGPQGPAGQAGPAGPQGLPGDPGAGCTVADNQDGTFTITCDGSAVTFGETEEPVEYTSADIARGGLLYDKFWTVTGGIEPTTKHGLYPSLGSQNGSTTWRCKECHGWDYIGKDGRYSSGSHYTGINGLYPANQSLWRAYMTISQNHEYSIAGLSSQDIWDLVKFYREGMIDINDVMNSDGTFIGNLSSGYSLYEDGIPGYDSQGKITNISCAFCHGSDGTTEVVSGFTDFPGFLSNDNPQEFLHKVRFGHPGSNPQMPAAEAINGSQQDVADLSAYSQTLSPVSWESTDVWRGGRLYDKYWSETNGSAPTGEHSLYPSNGAKTGNTTWRCKECHGWDYIGKYGRYSSGSHYTGIDGLYPASSTKWQAFNIIKTGHGYGNGELADNDIWDLVAFYDGGMYNINFVMNADGSFNGDPTNGMTLYDNGIGGTPACASCHGSDGLTPVVSGFTDFPGFLSNDNPQEFAHKVLYGQPGTLMSGIYNGGGAILQNVSDLSAYAQSLPEN